MNKDYKTKINIDYGFEVNALRPITTYSETLQNAQCANLHKHPRAQIISCDRGIMEVVTKEQIWIVNPSQSVWISSFEEHQVYFPHHVNIISVFIDASKLSKLPKNSFAFDTPDFFKSLLHKVISFHNPRRFSAQQNRVVEVLLDEISTLKPTTTFLPTSQNKRIKIVTDALLNDLSCRHNLAYFADKINVSPRTLSRLFNKELGMSFGDWRIKMKLMEAIKQLEEGKSVKEISFNLGYENVSSFISTFKKHLGKTPTNYKI